jgi:hypothetical protein
MSETPISSKKKKPRKRVATLSDGTEVVTDNNKYGNLKKGKGGKHLVPAKPFSTETGKTHSDWKVEDDYDSLEYPPPSTHPLFRKFWAESIEDLVARDNFKPAHLGLLEALCRLRVELRSLDDFIMANGHTFRVATVLGDQRKTFPEVNERLKVLTQIATYSKLLDLIPKKDKSRGKASKSEEDEWS